MSNRFDLALFFQELEDLIGSLSTDQLEELQAIMDRDHDEMTEFDLISGELAEMGVEDRQHCRLSICENWLSWTNTEIQYQNKRSQ